MQGPVDGSPTETIELVQAPRNTETGRGSAERVFAFPIGRSVRESNGSLGSEGITWKLSPFSTYCIAHVYLIIMLGLS